MRILTLNKDTKNDLLESLLKRSPNHYGEYEGRVNAIVSDVRDRKNEAIFEYTKKFDGAEITEDTILISDDEINTIINNK